MVTVNCEKRKKLFLIFVMQTANLRSFLVSGPTDYFESLDDLWPRQRCVTTNSFDMLLSLTSCAVMA